MRFTKEYLDRLAKISREAITELSDPASSSQGRGKLKAVLSRVPGGMIKVDGMIYQYRPKGNGSTSAFGDDLLIYRVNSLETSASSL